MKSPRRLKDDPEFLAEFGRVLEDEQLAVGNYDVDALRARVVGGAPVPAGPSWWKIAAVSGVTATLVTFALLQLRPAQVIIPVAPPSTPVLEELAPPSEIPAPRGTDGAAELDEPSPEENEPDILAPPEQPEVVEPVEQADPPDAVVDASEPPEIPAPPVESSALVAELADYNRAVEHNDATRWMDAHTAWSDYLSRWPDGHLRTEARLGMLHALVNADRPGEVERLAGELLATPGLGAHRDDLRVVRAEALVKLERCPDAVALLQGSKRSPRVNAVRTTCRKASRAP